MRQHLAILTLLGALSVVAATQAQEAPTLKVGSDAPTIQAKFVKGDAVKEFKKGSVYVVEFWATWCGPCKESIPHLTELAKKYKDKASFVGVSVWEDDQAKVAPFVKDFGSKMDYNVAMDEQASPTAREGKMSKTWMAAAGQDGIPTAFVVDQDSKIAWIGHPMLLAEPLDKVVNKTWDRDAYAKSVAAEAAKSEEAAAKDPVLIALNDYKAQMGAKQYDEALKTATKIEALAPTEKFPSPVQVGIQLNMSANLAKKEMVAWYKTGERFQQVFKNNPAALNSLAWQIADPASKFPVRKSEFAVKVAKMAVEASDHKDGAILDTLAWSYKLNKQTKLAVATEKLALKCDLDEATRKELKANLAKLRKD